MSIDTHDPDIPDKSWEIPFQEGTPLYDLFNQILQEERDIIIIIDDYKGRRGTGKTIASLQLADGMDQTQKGVTKSKVTMSPEELRNAYTDEPKRSGLVLDEGEVGASNRQAMTKTNQALREIMSMGRVEQKYVVVNTPIRGFIDKDIQKLADVWISMVRRGVGLVHFLDWETYSATLLTPRKQVIEIDDVPKNTDLRSVYNYLTKEKNKRMGGDEGNRFITLSEHKERLQKARKEARKEQRNEDIRGFARHEEVQESSVSQRVIAESVGLTQGQVSNILRENDDS